MKLAIYFKSKATGEIKRNLTIDAEFNDRARWKQAHKEIKKRWPELMGTVQRIDVKKDR